MDRHRRGHYHDLHRKIGGPGCKICNPDNEEPEGHAELEQLIKEAYTRVKTGKADESPEALVHARTVTEQYPI